MAGSGNDNVVGERHVLSKAANVYSRSIVERAVRHDRVADHHSLRRVARGRDIYARAAAPAQGNIVDDYVLHQQRRVVGFQRHAAAEVVGLVALNKISLDQRATKVADRNSPAVPATRHAVVRDGISDDLRSARRAAAA